MWSTKTKINSIMKKKKTLILCYLTLCAQWHPLITDCGVDGLPGAVRAELVVAIAGPGFKVIKLFSCSTQLSIKF